MWKRYISRLISCPSWAERHVVLSALCQPLNVWQLCVFQHMCSSQNVLNLIAFFLLIFSSMVGVNKYNVTATHIKWYRLRDFVKGWVWLLCMYTCIGDPVFREIQLCCLSIQVFVEPRKCYIYITHRVRKSIHVLARWHTCISHILHNDLDI